MHVPNSFSSTCSFLFYVSKFKSHAVKGHLLYHAAIWFHPGVLLCLTSWLTQDNYLLAKGRNYLHSSTALLAFSLFALFVISIERYLGAYYPIFHRTAVTRSRLLTVLVILLIFQTALWVISRNDIVISETVHVIIVVLVTFPPLMFINFKLFKISRKGRRMNETSPEKRKKIDLKNTATCLLAIGCFALLSIPSAFTSFSILKQKIGHRTQYSLLFRQYQH